MASATKSLQLREPGPRFPTIPTADLNLCGCRLQFSGVGDPSADQMISGLAKAAIVFWRSPYFNLASQAARFILDHQSIDGRFHRLHYDGVVSINAQSEDYALFIKALLDLDQTSLLLGDRISATGCNTAQPQSQSVWLEKAIAFQSEFDEWLWSIEQGGYYNTASDASDDLIVRERSYMDNATPAANGVAIANLIRLFLLTDDMEYLKTLVGRHMGLPLPSISWSITPQPERLVLFRDHSITF